MKFFIWIIAMFADALLITILKENGIILGGLPTAALYSLTFAAAAALTARWDWIDFKRKAKKSGKTPVQYAKSYYNTSIIDMCCTYYSNGSELNKRLKECINAETITKRDRNVLKLLFKDRNSLIEFGLISDY